MLTRRRLICGLFIGGTAAVVGARSAEASQTHTMWVLDPDWGFDLTTDNESDTKTSCRGRACHLAAPHRFFLSEADALAGRLHICCLAQPTPVEVCIDLNELMPYYTARHGGVDGRCPELPEHLRWALYGATPCAVPSVANPERVPETVADPLDDDVQPVVEPQPEVDPDGSTPEPAALDEASSDDTINELPVTGRGTATTLITGAAAIAAGAVVSAAARNRPSTPLAPHQSVPPSSSMISGRGSGTGTRARHTGRSVEEARVVDLSDRPPHRSGPCCPQDVPIAPERRR